MPSIIGLMTYKAANLRTIEKKAKTITTNITLQNELLAYIQNLKIILTCLLDSIHDFGNGIIMQGNGGYINYIIEKLIIEVDEISSDQGKVRSEIKAWITGWNNFAKKANPQITGTSLNDGSILQFIENAKGDSVENFVGFLLDVEMVTLNRFDAFTLIPPPPHAIHRKAFAVVNDHNGRKIQCPTFFGSLYDAASQTYITPTTPAAITKFKFFTVRDQGFVSYIFYNRDTNAVPAILSQTDTIFSSPGMWDNGAAHGQSVKGASGSRKTIVVPLQIETRNIIHELNAQLITAPNIVNMRTRTLAHHADGGVLGFRFIRTDFNAAGLTPTTVYSDQIVKNALSKCEVTFGNTIFLSNSPPNNYVHYETRITFSNIKKMKKANIKKVIKMLMDKTANITVNSLKPYKEELGNFFKPPVGAYGPLGQTGWTAINHALSQSGQEQTKNAMMIFGCVLDIKRTGDFLQSASVKKHKDEYYNAAAGAAGVAGAAGGYFREGIFATNDRIAGYISAKIHENYTILSSPSPPPFTMLTVWNGVSTTKIGPTKASAEIHQLSKIDKSTLPIGGCNKKQKNKKKKMNGGVLYYDYENYIELKESFNKFLNNYLDKPKLDNDDKEYLSGQSRNIVQMLRDIYGYININRELIINLLRSYFSAKITWSAELPPEGHYEGHYEGQSEGQSEDVRNLTEELKTKYKDIIGEELSNKLLPQDEDLNEEIVEKTWGILLDELIKTKSETDAKTKNKLEAQIIEALALPALDLYNDYFDYLDEVMKEEEQLPADEIFFIAILYQPLFKILDNIFSHQKQTATETTIKAAELVVFEENDDIAKKLNKLDTFNELVLKYELDESEKFKLLNENFKDFVKSIKSNEVKRDEKKGGVQFTPSQLSQFTSSKKQKTLVFSSPIDLSEDASQYVVRPQSAMPKQNSVNTKQQRPQSAMPMQNSVNPKQQGPRSAMPNSVKQRPQSATTRQQNLANENSKKKQEQKLLELMKKVNEDDWDEIAQSSKKNYILPPITYDFNKLIELYTDNIDENVFEIYQVTSDMMEKYKYEITYLKELGKKLVVVQDERGASGDMEILRDEIKDVLEHFLLFQEIENDNITFKKAIILKYEGIIQYNYSQEYLDMTENHAEMFADAYIYTAGLQSLPYEDRQKYAEYYCLGIILKMPQEFAIKLANDVISKGISPKNITNINIVLEADDDRINIVDKYEIYIYATKNWNLTPGNAIYIMNAYDYAVNDLGMTREYRLMFAEYYCLGIILKMPQEFAIKLANDVISNGISNDNITNINIVLDADDIVGDDRINIVDKYEIYIYATINLKLTPGNAINIMNAYDYAVNVQKMNREYRLMFVRGYDHAVNVLKMTQEVGLMFAQIYIHAVNDQGMTHEDGLIFAKIYIHAVNEQGMTHEDGLIFAEYYCLGIILKMPHDFAMKFAYDVILKGTSKDNINIALDADDNVGDDLIINIVAKYEIYIYAKTNLYLTPGNAIKFMNAYDYAVNDQGMTHDEGLVFAQRYIRAVNDQGMTHDEGLVFARSEEGLEGLEGGGSTKVVVYSDKIKKLTELNKKLRKNKIKNKNKIEKNNKQINELKDKIKKQKQKEKEKNKKEKQKEKEKVKKEIKQPVKKETKQAVKKETKQQVKKETKQPVKKETKQPVKKEIKQPVKKETKQAVKKETKQQVKKETEQADKKETKQQVKKETKQQVKKETKQQVKKETKQPVKKETKQPVKKEIKQPVKKETKQAVKKETKQQVKKETKQPVKKEIKQPVKKETKQQVKKETKQQVKKETKQQVKKETKQ